MRLAIAMTMALALLLPARADRIGHQAEQVPGQRDARPAHRRAEGKGNITVARVDHAAAAKAAGLELKPTEVLLFGNPKLGTPLMQANRHVAIDLPMKVLVWEDDAGKVWIGYTTPETLKARYRIDGKDDVLKTMAGALEAFSSAATK